MASSSNNELLYINGAGDVIDLEQMISSYREDTIKGNRDLENHYRQNFEMLSKRFSFLESVGQPDHAGWAEAKAKFAEDMKEVSAIQKAWLNAMDAMEVDIRKDHAAFEKRTKEEEGDQAAFAKYYDMRAYYRGPPLI